MKLITVISHNNYCTQLSNKIPLYKILDVLYFFSDNIKVKEKMRSKRNKKKDQQTEFFEDAPPFDENASFYQMNLSRPLLKVKLVIMITFCKLYLCNVHVSFSSASVLFVYTNMWNFVVYWYIFTLVLAYYMSNMYL
jgi:hypothetical protein